MSVESGIVPPTLPCPYAYLTYGMCVQYVLLCVAECGMCCYSGLSLWGCDRSSVRRRRHPCPRHPYPPLRHGGMITYHNLPITCTIVYLPYPYTYLTLVPTAHTGGSSTRTGGSNGRYKTVNHVPHPHYYHCAHKNDCRLQLFDQ